jgi:hypothetical protein
MTEKQKANELVDRYVEYVEAYSSQGQIENAKICALIAVNEMLDFHNNMFITEGSAAYQYWQDVKREIQAIKS